MGNVKKMEEESMRDIHTKNVWKTLENYFINLYLKYKIVMYININVATIINWEEISDWYWSPVSWKDIMEMMEICLNYVWNIYNIFLYLYL